MANNTELITGRGEDAHVSSYDMRSFNRAIFGTGKYRFTDAENMEFEVDTVSKLFTIKSGSCMWSGMHIRIEEEEAVSFVSPATTANVYLWLHYKRSASTLVESIEFISTTSNKVESSLIYDKLPDDVAEAYTLFATVEYDAVNNVVRTVSSDFELVKSMSDFYKETTQTLATRFTEQDNRITTLSTEITTKADELETNLNDTIDNFKNIIVAAAHQKFILYSGDPGVLSQGNIEIELSDWATNYALLEIQVNDEKKIITTNGIGNKKISFIVTTNFTSEALEFRKIIFDFNQYAKKITLRYSSIKVSSEALGTTSFTSSLYFKPTISIVGIGEI